MNKNHEKLNRILKYSDQLIDKIPDQSNPHKIFIFTYYLSLFDIANDIVLLADNNRLNNIPTLVRSFIETYIDMELLAQNENYIHVLIVKAEEEEIRKLESILNKNDLTPEIRKQFTKQKQDAEQSLTSHKNRDNIPIFKSIKDKFRALNMLDFYNISYNDLCGHTHNNAKQIEQKFISMNADQTKVTLKHLAKNNPVII